MRADFTGGSSTTQAELHVDTNAGVAAFDSGKNVGGSGALVEDYGDWWRVSFVATNNASGNTTLTVYLFGAICATPGSRNTSIQGAAVVDGCQLELNVSAVSSLIVTTNGPAVRAADTPAFLADQGAKDVVLIYGDDSTETLYNQPIPVGWWPAQSRPHLKQMSLYPAGSLP